MQKVNLLTYSDANYAELQKKTAIKAIASSAFDAVISKTREDLVKERFYEANKFILDQPRGGGYWLWKPFFIFQALFEMEQDDILLYVDCGDSLEELDSIREFLLNTMQDKDMILTEGAFKHSDYTKRDCFMLMNCDEEKYHNAIQLEAGMCVFKNTLRSRQILMEWIINGQDPRIITDQENEMGLNLPGFKDHRHDQSILTNLWIKHKLYSSGELRKYVHGNQNKL